jgi:hypothetical protein
MPFGISVSGGALAAVMTSEDRWQTAWSMHGSCLGAHSNICETESRTRHNP